MKMFLSMQAGLFLRNAAELLALRRLGEKVEKIEVNWVKTDTPTGGEDEKQDIEKRREDHFKFLDQPRINRLSCLGIAIFDPETGLCKITTQSGKRYQTMGFTSDGVRYLYPEEAVFLVEMNDFQIQYNDVPLSLQQCYRTVLFGIPWPQYVVYSQLTRKGYIVARHKPISEPTTSTKDDTTEPQKLREPLTESACDPEEPSTSASEKVHFAQELLNNFPDNQGGPMTFLSGLPEKCYLEGIRPTSEQMLSDSRNFEQRRHIRRRDKPWESLRPRWWKSVPSSIRRNAKNWKQFTEEKDSWHNRRQNFSPPRVLWEGSCKPLVYSEDFSNTIRIAQNLDIVGKEKKQSQTSTQVSERQLQYTYDVHLVDSGYCIGLDFTPNHRLVIISHPSDLFPSFFEIAQLKERTTDKVPIHVAIVDASDICYYNMDTVMVPCLV